jgi:Ca2+-transporting ATPase
MPHDNAREPLLGSHHHHGASNHEASSTGGFAYTIADLAPLTDPTNPTTPSQMGGIDKILKGLKVDPKVGLHSDEADSHSTGKDSDGKFSARSKAFGRNVSWQLLLRFCVFCVWEKGVRGKV